MNCLPMQRAHLLAEQEEQMRWLVADLWAEGAVGVIGGEPKSCKSFLALDLAVAVASGTKCLARFPVANPGSVLLYAAEDAAHVVRSRLDGIAIARGRALEELPIHVITAPTVRLDLPKDRERLANTVAALRPRILLLDPFVRLHRVDENASGEIAPLLAHLRELNRTHGVAVVIVHHAKKGGSSQRAGQALRGSSEFHAWGDSNLYLSRRGEALTLEVEHRASRSIDPLYLALSGDPPVLGIVTQPELTDDAAGPRDRVLDALNASDTPMRVARLREQCQMRTQTLVEMLRDLVADGVVEHTMDGYRAVPARFRFPTP